MFALHLSGENYDLAKAEALALLPYEHTLLESGFLLLHTKQMDSALAVRLAYTKALYQVLFTTTNSTLKKDFSAYNWASIYKKNFAVRTSKNLPFKAADLASHIWNSVSKPKVNLEKPSTLIEIIAEKDKIYCCLLLKQIQHEFADRKPHKKPGFQPISLSPKLARALVNLSGVQKGPIVDPFCGVGGILVEAGLMGLQPIGSDISDKAIKFTEQNLKHYKVINYKIEKRDAAKLQEKVDYVVTDLPYGNSSIITKDLTTLYSDFLAALSKKLKKRAILVFPDFIDYKKLIKNTKLKLKGEYSYYIHKSLTKKILILEK